MGRRLALSALITLILGTGAPQYSKADGTLDIYFIDVEGGAATLIVTPTRESVLIDTGWKRPDDRDAKRIYDVAAKEAGLKRIDSLITTHFHRDHYGGILALTKLIPIGTFYDHGPVTDVADDNGFRALYADYNAATGGKHQTLHSGDIIPLKSGSQPIVLKCLVANGTPIGSSGRENPLCAQATQMEPDPSENARSLGFELTFGRFHFLDLGDLTWNIESSLVCPKDLIGSIDVYQVTHHGMKTSNNPVLIGTVGPTVAIMNNGAAKGGGPETYARLKAVASIKDIWQLHRNLASGDSANPPEALIANLAAEQDCTGHWIKVAVAGDSKRYQVANSRNSNKRIYFTQ